MISDAKMRMMCLSSLMTLPIYSFAQDVSEEEVIVTGIRASIQNAATLKEDASGILDAISAEELGKFPDGNVAESLQRVPGVAIARGRGGDGRFITVRGLGEEFNAVTYNGRLLATENIGREFSFDNIASELVSKVEVYKSSQASLGDGSIGGRVNVVSAKPFDNPGTSVAYSIAGLYDDLADDTGVKASGVFSSTFADDTFGILASLNYTERDFRVDVAESIDTFSINLYEGMNDSGARELRGYGTEDDVPTGWVAAGSGDYSSRSFGLSTEERKRLGGSLAFQFRPSDTFEATIDLLYTKFESPGEYFAAAFYPCPVGCTEDNGLFNVEQAANGVLTHFDYAQSSEANSRFQEVDTETSQLGFNGIWQASDNLEFVADLSWSQAEGQRDNIVSGPGGGSFYVIGTPGRARNTYDFDGGEVGNFSSRVQAYDPDYYVGQSGAFIDLQEVGAQNGGAPRQYRGHFTRDSINEIEDTVLSLRLDGQYNFDDTALKFGVDYVDREKKNDFFNNRDRWCNYFCSSQRYALRGIDPAAYDAMFTEFPVSDFLGDLGADVPRNFPVFTRDGLRNLYNQLEAGDRVNDAEGNPLPLLATNGAGNPVNADGVAYTDAGGNALPPLANGYVLDFGGTPISAVHDFSGVANTDGGDILQAIARPTLSNTIEEEVFGAYFQLDWAGDLGGKPWNANAGVRVVHTELTSRGVIDQITNIERPGSAPDQTFSFSNDTAVSFSTSYTDVLPAFNISMNLADELIVRGAFAETITRPTLNNLSTVTSIDSTNFGTESFSSGNPELKPTRSNNVDLSLEYYGEALTASAALFYKDISDTVSNSVTSEFLGEGQSWGRNFNATRPTNNDSAEITGVELALVHLLDSGFGYQANMTVVDSRSENADGSTTDLENVSDLTYNLSGFYESDKFSVRLSYNLRGEYLREISGLQGRTETVDDYGQLDLTASFNVSDNLTLFAEGVNLTEENEFVYFDGKKNFLRYYEERGMRVNFGLRGTF